MVSISGLIDMMHKDLVKIYSDSQKRKPWGSRLVRDIELRIKNTTFFNKRLVFVFIQEIRYEIARSQNPAELKELANTLQKMIKDEAYAVNQHVHLRNAAIAALNEALRKEHINKKKMQQLLSMLKSKGISEKSLYTKR